MTTARKQQICLESTPYYHCVSRCVRRTFLCGYDEATETSFEHRREWIEAKIKQLSSIYCIDICAYSVMSNHYHLVVHIDKEKAQALTDQEIIDRWCTLHNKPVLIQRLLTGDTQSDAEFNACKTIIDEWRSRLANLSWFMRELNLDIATQANKEDKCTGHFWEGRFKCQALLDEQALAAAMVYVDLNPIRAGIAKTPEKSDYTSIRARLQALKNEKLTAPSLHPFIGNPNNAIIKGIPMRLMDYIELVDWTGRQLRQGKTGYIHSSTPPILQRLNFEQQNWLKACTQFERQRALLIGSSRSIQAATVSFNRSRAQGYRLTT
ncbi:transposase [Photobacterium sagamiensis]|uniref:transposase n=1 Tax=Photobacterium sagamiensis TaxID=2910241 RepID=UPI003D149F9E